MCVCVCAHAHNKHKTLKGKKTTTDQLETLGPKEKHVVSSLGFLPASYILELELNKLEMPKDTNTKKNLNKSLISVAKG